MIDFKGGHFERQVVLWGVRWYVAYPMSYRQLEEMMEERGVDVDSTLKPLGRQIRPFAGEAALRFLRKAMGQHGEPEKITIATRAAPTRRRSKATMRSMKRTSKSAASNISIISSSRTIER